MNKHILFPSILLICMNVSLFSQIPIPGIRKIPVPDMRIQLDNDAYPAGESGMLSVIISFPEGYHQTKTPETFKIEGVPVPGMIYGKTIYPQGIEKDGVVNYYDKAELQLEFFPADTLPEGLHQFELNVFYQLCDEDGTCYFPQSLPLIFDLTIEASPAGEFSILYYLILALIGGFLLNLMPCVLPLLSVKALNLINQSQGNKRSILINAFYYAAGIIVSFIGLAAVIIILQKSGQLLGWGFQFQNPYFLIILISVIFLFSLSLFEVFILLPPVAGLNKASDLSSRKGFAGSFFTGVFAVFVATPCTAPFLGAAMGFAFSQPAGVIIAIMIATGLGLSLPFLILGFFPSFFNFLPKPGKWMDKFREFMAFLLMGTVVYLSSTLIKQIGQAFISVAWYLLILALGGWIWGWIMRKARRKQTRNLLILITAGAVILSGVLILDDINAADGNKMEISSLRENWQTFSPSAIEKDVENGETVFLAFSSSWCTTCKINEKTVLYTDEADKLFSDYSTKLYKADLTKTNEKAMEWIYSFDRAGVPLYILYKKGEEPEVLPEILSLSLLKEALSE